MHDGIEGETKSAKLLFLSLLKRVSDFTAFTVVNVPAETMAQFRVVELGQNTPAERGVVDVVKDTLGHRRRRRLIPWLARNR